MLLVADCPTKWVSMAKMVSRIVEQEEAICVVLLNASRKTTHLVSMWRDVDVLQSIHQALTPLSSFTDMLPGEKYATVSAMLPILKLTDD